jgi:hypothetical protein
MCSAAWPRQPDRSPGGRPVPTRDRPVPLPLSDDDLDFYGHDHHYQRQENERVKHLIPLDVKPAGEVPPAFSFCRECMNERLTALPEPSSESRSPSPRARRPWTVSGRSEPALFRLPLTPHVSCYRETISTADQSDYRCRWCDAGSCTQTPARILGHDHGDRIGVLVVMVGRASTRTRVVPDVRANGWGADRTMAMNAGVKTV